MANFIIVGGKAKKARNRFGGEQGSRKCDSSFSRRHLKLTERSLWLADLEEICDCGTARPAGAQNPAEQKENKKRSRRTHHTFALTYERIASSNSPSVERRYPAAVFHNSRKIITYPDGMRIASATY